MTDKESNTLERSIGRLEGKLDAVVGSVEKLATAFDNLEKGRLSALEIQFAKLYTETKDRARTSALWVSVFISICVSVISAAIIYNYVHK